MTGPPPYALSPSTVVDALHAELRDRMMRGELEPGETVTEARFVADYGVARATARGALERLLSEGLLERTQRRTLQVRRFSLEDLEDIWCVREGLESSAVRRLVREGIVPAAALQAQAELVALVTAGAGSEVRRRADVAFHRALVAGAGSARLDRMYGSVLVEVRLASRLLVAACPAQVRQAVAEHQAVLEAIGGRDEEGAVRSLVEHLSGSRRRITGRVA
ncbi:GntR family transcriptional regulator [Kineococcus sp. SYSU DK003]|uniref:GntR family transcriptional regulator n=1 Tax=Kineococcus sp. SYSU DK003 TaxID=3383124 RepID=UPI003D7C8705